jgi:hypothetical protein
MHYHVATEEGGSVPRRLLLLRLGFGGHVGYG